MKSFMICMLIFLEVTLNVACAPMPCREETYNETLCQQAYAARASSMQDFTNGMNQVNQYNQQSYQQNQYRQPTTCNSVPNGLGGYRTTCQ